jgi:hypothetical protein
MITCKIPLKVLENLKEIYFLVFGILFVHDQTKTVAANSQYVSLSFSSVLPFSLNAPFISELSLPQTKSQPRVPKNICPKSLEATPSIPFLHSKHTPKINKLDQREREREKKKCI